MAGTISFSDNQLRAINTRGADLLVSAAAGSGKTAVLVERIISMIVADEPLSIDRLLIVTFSNAAASEMKNRIYSALHKLIKDKHENSAYLKRQLMLLGGASISTIHSLCQSIIRQNFQVAEIDPGFSTIIEPELSIIKAQVCSSMFEELHALEYRHNLLQAFINDNKKALRTYMLEYGVSTEDELYEKAFDNMTFESIALKLKADRHIEGFWRLLNALSRKIKDDTVQELVIEVFDKVSAQPNPDAWLDEKLSIYDTSGIYQSAWYAKMKKSVLQDITAIILELQNLDESRVYIEKYKSLLGRLNDDLTGFVSGLYELDFAEPAKAVKDKVLKKTYKNLDKMHNALIKSYAKKPAEAMISDIKNCRELVETFSELLKRFGGQFAELKKRRNCLDFSDYEHLCLKVITGIDGESVLSTLKLRFDEIFIDEYQDTSGVQELILQSISAKPERNNLFMVGDLKQSIYKFRLASPELFRHKYQSFSRDKGAACQKIDLSENFRSRKNVIDSINFIFKNIMSEEVGELEYDEYAELKYGATYYDTVSAEEPDLSTEFYIIDEKLSPEGEDADDLISELSSFEVEAKLVAKRITELIDGRFQVYESEGKTRNLRYSDIALLMKSVKTAAPAFIREFSKLDIEAYSQDSGGGYFNEIEISTMLCLLSIIDNPYQDIDLICVLYSPIYGLTADELTEIRVAAPKLLFFDAMLKFRDFGNNESINTKLTRFMQDLAGYREKTKFMPVHELVWELINSSGFFDYAGSLQSGNQRQANLLKLYDAAFEYEKTGLTGYFNFVKYFQTLKDKADTEKAKIISEGGDAVRIMTIHKSKGLEFPIVFVCGLGKQFNDTDLKKNVFVHQDLGIAMNYVDLENRIQCSTLIRDEFKRRMKAELWSEEMRCLYVALTRAKEKLILVGTIKGYGNTDIRTAGRDANGKINPAELLARRTYMSWLLPCFYDEEDELFWEADASSELKISRSSNWRLYRVSKSFCEQPGSARLKSVNGPGNTRGLNEKSLSALDFVYPGKTTEIPAKLSVSEIKRLEAKFLSDETDELLISEGVRAFSRSAFLDDETNITGAQKGSIMHFVMEKLDLRRSYSECELRDFVSSLSMKKELSEKEAKAVEVDKLLAFFCSDLACRIRRSQAVFKEKRFIAGLLPEEINPQWVGDGELTLINGIIDCYFVEDGELVLIDYKTDKVWGNNIAEIKERYSSQIRLYKKALEINTGLNVKESWLYLFDNGGLVRM